MYFNNPTESLVFRKNSPAALRPLAKGSKNLSHAVFRLASWREAAGGRRSAAARRLLAMPPAAAPRRRRRAPPPRGPAVGRGLQAGRAPGQSSPGVVGLPGPSFAPCPAPRVAPGPLASPPGDTEVRVLGPDGLRRRDRKDPRLNVEKHASVVLGTSVWKNNSNKNVVFFPSGGCIAAAVLKL